MMGTQMRAFTFAGPSAPSRLTEIATDTAPTGNVVALRGAA